MSAYREDVQGPARTSSVQVKPTWAHCTSSGPGGVIEKDADASVLKRRRTVRKEGVIPQAAKSTILPYQTKRYGTSILMCAPFTERSWAMSAC